MPSVFLVGRIVDDTDRKSIRWRLLGVYSAAPLAEDACETLDDFVRPVTLDENLPDIHARPSKIYFPKDGY
jgi:hypothetical protein